MPISASELFEKIQNLQCIDEMSPKKKEKIFRET